MAHFSWNTIKNDQNLIHCAGTSKDSVKCDNIKSFWLEDLLYNRGLWEFLKNILKYMRKIYKYVFKLISQKNIIKYGDPNYIATF